MSGLLKLMKLPPKCPSCEQPLDEVFENEYNTFVFDRALGTYKEHQWKGDIEIRCPNCDAKLYDVFPEGACNYVSGDEPKGVEGMTLKQAIYWLSVALQIHNEPEIIQAFKIAMDELSKEAYREELHVGTIYC